jgi:hypothetical protein
MSKIVKAAQFGSIYLVSEPLEHAPMKRADEFRVAVRKVSERTVGKRDRCASFSIYASRIKAEFVEHPLCSLCAGKLLIAPMVRQPATLVPAGLGCVLATDLGHSRHGDQHARQHRIDRRLEAK